MAVVSVLPPPSHMVARTSWHVTAFVFFCCYQTGSGKTFTITGGAERYTDRGIIPRALSYVFDYYQKVIP